MYMVVGLGNPGLMYSTTRHNIGFEVIERLAYEHHIKLSQKKHKALVGQGSIGQHKVLLAQPQTYMNLSGESIRQMIDFYKLETERLIVIYDDASLDLGRLRIRKKGSAGGHNGIKNIIAHLGTQEFPRLKVGIGHKPPGWDIKDYVLSRFQEQEMPAIIQAVKTACDAIEIIVQQDMDKAMNLYNTRNME